MGLFQEDDILYRSTKKNKRKAKGDNDVGSISRNHPPSGTMLMEWRALISGN